MVTPAPELPVAFYRWKGPDGEDRAHRYAALAGIPTLPLTVGTEQVAAPYRKPSERLPDARVWCRLQISLI